MSPGYPPPPLNTGHQEEVLEENVEHTGGGHLRGARCRHGSLSFLEACIFLKDLTAVRVGVIVPRCAVWQVFPEAEVYKTKGPFHLKRYFVDKAFTEKMGFQTNIFLPHRKKLKTDQMTRTSDIDTSISLSIDSLLFK